MKKKILFALPLVLAMTLFLSWNHLVAFATKKYLERYCLECFGAPTELAIVSDGANTLTIKKPAVKTAEGLEEGGLAFSADNVKVSYRFLPFFSGVDLDITVDNPDIMLHSEADLPALIKRLFGQETLLNYYPRIHVQDGVIKVCDSERNPKKEHLFYYSATVDLINKNHGFFKVCCDDPSFETNSFDVSFHRDEKIDYNIVAAFHNVDFGFLSEAMGNLSLPLGTWSINRGFVDGSVSIKKERGKRLDARGMMSVKDLIIKDKNANLTAKVGGATIDLKREGSSSSTTLGRVEITDKSAFIVEYHDIPTCVIEDIEGSVTLESHDGAQIHFSGRCQAGAQSYNVALRGEGRYFDEDLTCLTLETTLYGEDGKEAIAGFDIKQLNDIWYAGAIHIKDFGFREFQFVQQVMRQYSKDWDDVKIHKGSVDAKATTSFAGMSIQNMEVETFTLHDVAFTYLPWDVYGSVNNAQGTLTANLATDDILQSLNTELAVNDGLIRMTGVDKEPWQLTDIHTKFTCKNGVIQKSTASATFGGLKGTIDIDPLSKRDIVRLTFSGEAQGLTEMIPSRLQKGWRESFYNDKITISSGVHIADESLQLNGLVEVKDHEKRNNGDIAFGFEVKKAKGDIEGQNENLSAFEEEKFLSLLLPPIAAPAEALKKRVADYDSGIAGYLIRNGWVYAENLSLAKFVAPFALLSDDTEDSPYSLVGYGDFHGAFNHLGLATSYDVRDLALESQDFRFEVESLYSARSGDKDTKELGVHYVDFTTGNHFGKMPVKHGSYLEKNSGLLFSEISAEIKLEGEHIHASALDTFCQGIHFAGSINIDYSSPENGVFDVEIVADTMDGKLSQVQSLFARFDKPIALTDFPMEGNLHFCNQGGYFLFHINPEGSSLTSSFDAALTDGHISFAPLDLSFQELEMNVSYDQRKNTLTMDEIRGTLLAGPPDDVDEYLFAGDKIAFSDLSNNISTFDMWVGDKNRDLIRVVGTTQGASDPLTGQEEIIFNLDHSLSHFGDVRPTTFTLSIENWASIKTFEFDLDLKLETLLKDIQRVSRTGIFFLPKNTLKELNAIESGKGTFNLHFDYHDDTNIFHYDAHARDVEVDPYTFENIHLKGSVQNKIWSVDELQIDDLSLSVEMAREENMWKLNFLGLRSGKSLLLGLEGEYRDGESAFDARVNLFEVNFSELEEWPQLLTFVTNNNPKGILRGRGKMRIEKPERSAGWRCDGSFTASSQSMSFRNLALADAEGFSCHFISDKGLTLRKIKTALFSPLKNDTSKVGVHFEKIHFDSVLDELEFEGVNFVAPQKTLKWFPKSIQGAFPEDISNETVEIVSNLKQSGSLIGSGNIKVSGDNHLLTVSLIDGTYHYEGSEHRLSDFKFSHKPGKFHIAMKYLFEDRLLKLVYQTQSAKADKGIIAIRDVSTPENSEKKKGILLHWEQDPNLGFNITEAEGAIHGLQVHLKRDYSSFMDKDHHNISGYATVSFPQASNLFRREFQQGLYENQMGGEYHLKGQWSFAKSNAAKTEFSGVAQATNFIFKGYRLENLQAHLDYLGDKAEVKDLVISDAAAHVNIPSIHLTHAYDKWYMFIPSTHVTSFRPNYLKEVEEVDASTTGRTFVMPTIEVTNLKGELGDSSTWVGEGMFTFKNTTKKSLQNTILAIPHEIITRIGLNPAVLTPVNGTVFYKVKDRKVIFTKFKDIYSESRASKFYLPRSSFESYIDFDKNLNIQVRMKQHNLLFKLAELFIFTVKGNLDNPLYTIQKQDGKR